jgi:excisionase family DNA binding protein
MKNETKKGAGMLRATQRPSRSSRTPAVNNGSPSIATGQDERLAFSQQETANKLGVSLKTVANWIASGNLHAVKIGGRVLIPAAAIDDLLSGGDHE